MATVQDLKAVVAETLEHRGVLNQLRARIRSEVFRALDEQSEPHPPLSNENLLVNELIREYLDFNQYKYTTSVFLAETGQPAESLDRDFLCHELGIVQDRQTSSVPILYALVADFLSRKSHSQKSHSAAFAERDERRSFEDGEQSSDGSVMFRGRGK